MRAARGGRGGARRCCARRRRSAGASTGRRAARADGLRRPRRSATALRRTGRRRRRAAPCPIRCRCGVGGAGRLIGQVAAAARRARQGRWIGEFRRRRPAARHGLSPRSARGRSADSGWSRSTARRPTAMPRRAAVVEHRRWVAAVATTWWAAERALDALAAAVRDADRRGRAARSIDAALDGGARPRRARGWRRRAISPRRSRAREWSPPTIAPGSALHAAIETMTATARYRDGRLELWMPTQAPGARARRGRAARSGSARTRSCVHPMLAGGSFGPRSSMTSAEQAAMLARQAEAPGAADLVARRGSACTIAIARPPRARMTARLAPNGRDPRLAGEDRGARDRARARRGGSCRATAVPSSR